MVQLLWKGALWFLKKLNTESACGPEIPFLDVHSKEKNICLYKEVHENVKETFFTNSVYSRNNPDVY